MEQGKSNSLKYRHASSAVFGLTVVGSLAFKYSTHYVEDNKVFFGGGFAVFDVAGNIFLPNLLKQ